MLNGLEYPFPAFKAAFPPLEHITSSPSNNPP
jgi:hypothetical protein